VDAVADPGGNFPAMVANLMRFANRVWPRQLKKKYCKGIKMRKKIIVRINKVESVVLK